MSQPSGGTEPEVREGNVTAGEDLGDGGFDEDEDNLGNRLVGAIPRAVLEYLARSIVDDPDGVVVEVVERGRQVELRLSVAPSDMGKIIGRRGHVAHAIRTLVRAAGAKEGIDASVDIID